MQKRYIHTVLLHTYGVWTFLRVAILMNLALNDLQDVKKNLFLKLKKEVKCGLKVVKMA